MQITVEVDDKLLEQSKDFMERVFSPPAPATSLQEELDQNTEFFDLMRPLAVRMAVEVQAALAAGVVNVALEEAAEVQAQAREVTGHTVFIPGQPVQFDPEVGTHYQEYHEGGRLEISSADAERIENWRAEGISEAAIDAHLRAK